MRLATKTPSILAHARYKSIAGLHCRTVPAPASVFFVVCLALGSLVASVELVAFAFVKVWLCGHVTLFVLEVQGARIMADCRS